MTSIRAVGVGVMTVLVLAACGASKPAAPFRQLDSSSDHALVEEHALRGAMIRDAVERGDLDGTKDAARALVELVTRHETPVPESRLDAMVQAARRVAGAQDLRDAAGSFAFLSERCGECHARIGGPPSFPATPPADALGVVPRMRRHQWAGARLWEGLVAPSDEAWKSGAQVLSDAPLGPESWAGKTTVVEIDALSASVHDLGVRAVAAEKASSRIAIYGELLLTCATCHQRIRGGPH